MFLHPISWPNGKKCAASVTFDIDADSLVRVGKPKDAELRLQPISNGAVRSNSCSPPDP